VQAASEKGNGMRGVKLNQCGDRREKEVSIFVPLK
jgi:hypothetical protein